MFGSRAIFYLFNSRWNKWWTKGNVALRAVSSTDGMTADYVTFLMISSKISNRIINNVKGINRVTYDISSKPTAN